jgi:hypothetical protein
MSGDRRRRCHKYRELLVNAANPTGKVGSVKDKLSGRRRDEDQGQYKDQTEGTFQIMWCISAESSLAGSPLKVSAT